MIFACYLHQSKYFYVCSVFKCPKTVKFRLNQRHFPLVLPTGHHECEIFGREGDEAAESATAWKKCRKNPKHKQFIPIEHMMTNPLIRSLGNEDIEWLRLTADLTVRLRVNHTSRDRPSGDELSKYGGSNNLRVGTGLLWYITPVTDEPCPCDEYDGKVVRTFWKFDIQTAQHVVYNTEEAKETKVDFFYDDDKSKENGKVVSVCGSCAVSRKNIDYCLMECVTHDERIVDRVKPIYERWDSLIPRRQTNGSIFM